jgi:signal transduction histidine kinase
MRLPDFITFNLEAIMKEWEAFARTTTPGAKMDKIALRDHVKDILMATVSDMQSAKCVTVETAILQDQGHRPEKCERLEIASELHAVGRLGSGFELLEVIAEYRALRASVLRLWRQSKPAVDEQNVEGLAQFNELVDQSLAMAVSSYTKQVDQARDMYLAILGHDLRNPLNSIAMSASILPRIKSDDPDFKTFTSQITKNAHVMARMIADLLDYTRTRLGAGMPVSPAPMDLDALCRELFKEFQSANPTREFHFESSGNLHGNWDTDRIRQAVSNLLGNAVQHGAQGTPIQLKLKGESKYVQIVVHNRGRSIPPGELAKIFDPLVQGAAAGKPEHNRSGSIGLGLYIAREIAISHGGQINVSSSDDSGTTFALQMPRHHLQGEGAAILDAKHVQELDIAQHH